MKKNHSEERPKKSGDHQGTQSKVSDIHKLQYLLRTENNWKQDKDLIMRITFEMDSDDTKICCIFTI